MKLQFLGASSTVTGSKYLLEFQSTKILVDCGMFQGLKELRLLNWKAPAFDPSSIAYVFLTHAHLDHVGFSAPLPDGHNVNNGADDDGSGSVGLLAMARAFADGAAKGIRPKRSVLFLWNGGEEKGLYGSQYFAA